MSLARSAVRKANKQNNDEIAEHAVQALQAGSRGCTENTIFFDLNGTSYQCTVLRAAEISVEERMKVMDLLEENMRDKYEASRQGWSRREKQGELFDRSARFMLVGDEVGDFVAFVNWRFDIEDCHEDDALSRQKEICIEVVYCYEVQVKSTHRSQRLGRILIEMLHSISHRSEMKKVMLTVFTTNLPAIRFYKRLGYSEDLISPKEEDVLRHNVDYIIMSKASINLD